jgi:hypothetical protein
MVSANPQQNQPAKSKEKSIMPSEFHSQMQPRLPILLLLLILAAATEHYELMMMVAGAEQPLPITLAGCPDKCGDTSIPFPFGMTPGCFRPGFRVVCNHSFLPPRAFLDSNGGETYQQNNTYTVTSESLVVNGSSAMTAHKLVELIDVSVATSEARVRAEVSSRCRVNATHLITMAITHLGITRDPFRLSATGNVLVAVGSTPRPWSLRWRPTSASRRRRWPTPPRAARR